jgi:hypothetical protein
LYRISNARKIARLSIILSLSSLLRFRAAALAAQVQPAHRTTLFLDAI